MAKYRRKIQLIVLILFLTLIFLGKVQLWMGIFLGSLLLSTIKGRFYCGYLCPINTAMEVIDTNAEKNRRKRERTPDWVKKSWVRYSMLALFLGTMIIVFRTGRKMPVLPVLFIMGVTLTIFFEHSLWHRYLCPYGRLFSIISRKNKFGYELIEEGCTRCGKCVKTCPAEAFSWENKKMEPIINKHDCLVCGKCEAVCPEGVIIFNDSKIKSKQSIQKINL